jgi:hypothetical protein
MHKPIVLPKRGKGARQRPLFWLNGAPDSGGIAAVTFNTYREFVERSSYYSACRVSDLTRIANPLRCGEEALARAGVSFPCTLFG